MTEIPIKNLYSQWVDSEWAVIFPPSDEKIPRPCAIPHYEYRF